MKVGDLVSCSDSASGPIGVVVRVIKSPPGFTHGQTVHILVGDKVVSYLAKDLWSFYESR